MKEDGWRVVWETDRHQACVQQDLCLPEIQYWVKRPACFERAQREKMMEDRRLPRNLSLVVGQASTWWKRRIEGQDGRSWSRKFIETDENSDVALQFSSAVASLPTLAAVSHVSVHVHVHIYIHINSYVLLFSGTAIQQPYALIQAPSHPRKNARSSSAASMSPTS